MDSYRFIATGQQFVSCYFIKHHQLYTMNLNGHMNIISYAI